MYVITIVLGTQKLEKGLMLIMLLRVNIIQKTVTDTIKEKQRGAKRIIAKMLGLEKGLMLMTVIVITIVLGTQKLEKRLMLIMLLSVNIIQKTVIVLTQKLEKRLILIMLLRVKIIIIVFVEKIRQIY